MTATRVLAVNGKDDEFGNPRDRDASSPAPKRAWNSARLSMDVPSRGRGRRLAQGVSRLLPDGFAGYNAGRGKVAEWVAKHGDPRDPKVDAIDWIERIPFAEAPPIKARPTFGVSVTSASSAHPGYTIQHLIRCSLGVASCHNWWLL